MAKKSLAQLMDGIMGDDTYQANTQEVAPKEDSPVSTVTDEMRDKLESKRRQNVGRPKKGDKSSKTEEIRATFIVEPELIRKIKYISLVEGTLLKDVISTALSTYIEDWESKNTKIRLPKLK